MTNTVLTHGDPYLDDLDGGCGRPVGVIRIPIPGPPLRRYECPLHGITMMDVWQVALDADGGLALSIQVNRAIRTTLGYRVPS